MDYIDVKYINLLSSRLSKFKKVKSHLYNFRCPICGDSQKNKNKARVYFYRVKNNTNYKCHNCGVNISFNNFLKDLDAPMHKEYVFEKFKDTNSGKNFVSVKEDIVDTLDFKKFLDGSKPHFKKKMSIDLPSAFEVNSSKDYLYRRGIFDGDFYYAKNFKEFVNTLKPNFFDSIEFGEARIVIPLVHEEVLIGVQGRALSSNPIKYITVMVDDEAPKIYGLDNVRKDAPVYVTEGPFDSTFLRNAIAMCGSDADVRKWGISIPTWIYDNEPRNREIVRRIEDTIDRGESVVIWPSNVREKDINDMVLCGHNVRNLVELNTYSGLEAKVKFNTWKKI